MIRITKALALVCLICLLGSGCASTWLMDATSPIKRMPEQVVSAKELEPKPEIAWGALSTRIILLPVAVAVDIVTAPVLVIVALTQLPWEAGAGH